MENMKGLKQADLARKLKIDRQLVNKWVHGQVGRLTPKNLFALADVLNVDARWLAFGPPESPLKGRRLTIEDNEILEIAAALKPKTRDAWVSSGREWVRLTAEASVSNPFVARRKQ